MTKDNKPSGEQVSIGGLTLNEESGPYYITVTKDSVIKNCTLRFADLQKENEANKKALRDIADGYPSEWAYTILKKDYDALVKDHADDWRRIQDAERENASLRASLKSAIDVAESLIAFYEEHEGDSAKIIA